MKNSGNWQKGQSGNPHGRPRGSGEIGRLREAISAALPPIIKKLVAAAKNGDVAAARLLLERTLPALKASGQLVSIELPDGNATEKAEAIIKASASGQIPPDQAAELIAALAAMGRIREFDELAARIAALEAARGQS